MMLGKEATMHITIVDTVRNKVNGVYAGGTLVEMGPWFSHELKKLCILERQLIFEQITILKFNSRKPEASVGTQESEVFTREKMLPENWDDNRRPYFIDPSR